MCKCECVYVLLFVYRIVLFSFYCVYVKDDIHVNDGGCSIREDQLGKKDSEWAKDIRPINTVVINTTETKGRAAEKFANNRTENGKKTKKRPDLTYKIIKSQATKIFRIKTK